MRNECPRCLVSSTDGVRVNGLLELLRELVREGFFFTGTDQWVWVSECVAEYADDIEVTFLSKDIMVIETAHKRRRGYKRKAESVQDDPKPLVW